MNLGDGETPGDKKEIREQQLVRRSKCLRTFCGVLTEEAFFRRKAFFVAKVCDLRNVEIKQPTAQHLAPVHAIETLIRRTQ